MNITLDNIHRMNPDILLKDNIKIILSYLSNRNKINFLSTNKVFHQLKNEINYRKNVFCNKIKDLWYYEQFEKIIIFCLIKKQNNWFFQVSTKKSTIIFLQWLHGWYLEVSLTKILNMAFPLQLHILPSDTLLTKI